MPYTREAAPPTTGPHPPGPYALDPYARDHHGEAARLRALGPVVEVLLPGGVRAWSVNRHDLVQRCTTDPRLSKDHRSSADLRSGRIPEDWPLTGMLRIDNMLTADGAEHRRLRAPLSKWFTSRNTVALHGAVEQTVAGLLDALPDHADSRGVVDLRRHFALPLPLTVIARLFGVPPHEWPELRRRAEVIFRTELPPETVGANQAAAHRLLTRVVAARRRAPGEDLTSALIALRDADPGALSEDELLGTLWVMLAAGHETTLGLITNAVRALLTHPRQRALAQRGGEGVWADVVEETLRWDAPIGNFLARYPTEDIVIGSVTVPAGAMLIMAYGAAGRDPDQHGPAAHEFDLTRTRRRHLSFGHGPHACLGAPLARHEATTALRALFARYPGLTLAVHPGELAPVPSLFSNSVTTLPVRLTP